MDSRSFRDPLGPPAELHRLGNGRYQVTLSDTGAGQSSLEWIALTRGGGDPVQDDLGSVLYLRDLDTGAFRSLGYRPTRSPARVYRTACRDGRFVLEREDTDGIGARLEVTVDPVLDLERRRLTLVNGGDRPRRLEITSYLEVVLFPADADAAHPAFAKLFVQTERDPTSGALLARRRPRAQGERWPCLVHALAGAEVSQWETDRLAFLGRGRGPANPLALDRPEPLSGAVGNVLDPILALRTALELAPGASAELLFVTGAAPDREGALALATGEIGAWGAGSRTRATMTPHEIKTLSDEPPISQALPDTTLYASEQLLFFNGFGGFSENGREYVIRLPWGPDGHRRPPQPWIDVIANPRAGVIVSEAGAGYTWARNSQANRLTPWSNDPVRDPHGEALYIRDERTGEAWSPLPGPRPAPADYEVRHGLGRSVFRCRHAGLDQETVLFVPREDPLRILRLRVTNAGAEARALSVFSYQRLVMGTQPRADGPLVTAARSDLASELHLLTAVNPEAGDFAGAICFAGVAVAGAAPERVSHTGDRLAFVGRHRDLADPVALDPRAVTDLDGRLGAGLDPCLAQRVRLTLAPGQTATLAFLLGEALDEAELKALAERYRDPVSIDAALAEVDAFWAELTGRVQVETPEPAIDLLLNGWLVYQNLSCRIWARSAFYQSGGAFGYRDQLQDAGALTMLRPDLARAQILLHAAHQLVEGDVLHWWHPAPMGRGLRTRFSDDLLWLPFVTAQYIRTSGDGAILAEPVPYLAADPLDPGEDERYLLPRPSGEVGELYDHCCRAIERSLTRGPHGLPLMGTGDWNDGMNRVGREGRGESVWLGFFLYRIVEDFLPFCEARGEAERAARWRAYRDDLAQALETAGWDGAWYRRAYYDDGTPLGSADDEECRIDALAQAWAVLSGAAPTERAERALNALERHLVDEADGLIRLLTPPFVDTPKDPGYIKGYVAGVRENGGQYTHAACWAVMALAAAGRRERAAPLLAMLSPVTRSATPEAVARWRLEPYVVAADVYGAPPHVGRGGWSWYTGSAGWWFRVALESILGIALEGGRTLVVRPVIPRAWPGFRVLYRLPRTPAASPEAPDIRVDIRVDNGAGGATVVAATLDGNDIPVTDGAVRVTLTPPENARGERPYRIEVRLG